MTKLHWPLLSMFSVICLLMSLTAQANFSTPGDSTDPNDGSGTFVYLLAVCPPEERNCTPPDVWQVTIVWERFHLQSVTYTKVLDRGWRTTEGDARAAFVEKGRGTSCLRNIKYCPKSGGG